MTDIVQRLKQLGECHLGTTDVAETAAYEIECLRDDLEEARNERDKLRVILGDVISWCNRNDEDPWWLEIAKEVLEET